MKKPKIIVTCEHASKRVPRSCQPHFELPSGASERHRIYDWGTRGISRKFAEITKAPLFEGVATRLAIDLNRSLDNPGLFSPCIQKMDESFKSRLIARYYLPFRQGVEQQIGEWIASGRTVVHFSIHSFTPCLNGQIRTVDIGVLYDESRPYESALSQDIIAYHRMRYPSLSVDPNEPYKGTDDGHTTALRQTFPRHYAGIEIEYSQALPLVRQRNRWARDLRSSLHYALAQGKQYEALYR